jgi:signal transduction histidine kinase
MKKLGMSLLSSIETTHVWARRLRIGSIRTRLLLAFVLMAVLSAIAISIGSMAVGYFNGRQQIQDRLESVTALKALSIKAWEESLETGLLTVSSDQFASQRVSVVLGLAKLGKDYVWYDEALRVRLLRFIEESKQFDEICLVDVRGTVVLCSVSREETQDCYAETFFQQAQTRPFTEIVFSSTGQGAQSEDNITAMSGPTAQASLCDVRSPESGIPIAIVARSVTSSDGESLGVIVGRANTDGLIEVLDDRTGLGRTGEAYIVNPSFSLLSASAGAGPSNRDAADLRHSEGVEAALRDRSQISGTYTNYRGESALATYRWLPDLQVVLAVEQDLSEAFGGILTSLIVNGTIALVAALAAGGVSFVITRSITQPLVSLVETATQIASGNLEHTAPVLRDDEIGMLAAAFNSMTAQLRDLINHLEQRVQKRTRALNEANEALRRRALQMETSASVSRQITSILEIDELLKHVVHLIRDAFGYSHARIFLLDGEELIQRANTSEGAVGIARVQLALTSLNAEAVRSGQPVMVNDVTSDPRFLREEPLPDTRSELAIPLRVAERVIGTLDVLSSKSNAFASEDVLVIQSLGDQIAVAIENARLYARSRDLAVLEERHRLARDLHDSVIQSLYSLSLLSEGWRRLLRSGETMNVEEYFDRAASIAQQALREMRLMVYELRPASLEQDGLLGALRQRLDAVERHTGVKTRLVAERAVDLPLQVEECLYHIGQEALNNALKHSGATEVTLRLQREGNQVVLRVEDNGRGFAPVSPDCQGGMGLNNMRQRAEEMRGALIIDSELGKGTTVTAKIGV